MKLTKEEAVRLFHEQWSDMQKELGDRPDPDLRQEFKSKWCRAHFPEESIAFGCFLCVYAEQASPSYIGRCYQCPIAWPLNYDGKPDCCNHIRMNYLLSPISEILALPVREEVPNDTNETI